MQRYYTTALSLQQAQRRAGSVPRATPPSRTRLVKDLKRGSGSGGYEVAPKQPKQEPRPVFSRDSVPHAGMAPRQERNLLPRRSPRSQSAGSEVRRGRWGLEDRGGRESATLRMTENRPAPGNRPRPSDGPPRYGLPRDSGNGNYRPGRHASRPDSVKSELPRYSVDTSRSWTDTQPQKYPERRPIITNTLQLPNEFYHAPQTPIRSAPPHIANKSLSTSQNQLPTTFTSPPLMPGLLSCLTDVLGPGATPTPIQSLSLKWLFDGTKKGESKTTTADVPSTELGKESGWKQFLLASETGSGKSIAYLLPVLQSLKQSEIQSPNSTTPLESAPRAERRRALNPRALILAPTHELSRQLSGFAKALLHEIKLRVLCASRANVKNTKKMEGTASKMAEQFDSEVRRSEARDGSGEFEVSKGGRSWPVDLVVGTPMKLLEMVRGRGWDRKEGEEDGEAEESDEHRKARRGRDRMVGFGKWRSEPEMGLGNVEWVVVDEADVLFDSDFQETTRMLLADISAARGQAVSFTPESSLSTPDPTSPPTPASPQTSTPNSSSTESHSIDYPFNLLLTSATIPSALAAYLDKHHPKLVRLASPNLHHLPKTLQTEYVNWTGGNKNADIERRIRRVWAEDSSFGGVAAGKFAHGGEGAPETPALSKVLVFCNRSSKVQELGAYLSEKGIKNIALTSTSDTRKRGSNHHLDGFLRKRAASEDKDAAIHHAQASRPTSSNPAEVPHVMITTSLLSRGLDFSPTIRHVFIVDEPRNMIDFLHRAGRSGRAGERGKVVVFGKMKGRGSAKAKDVRKRVGALVV